MGIITCGPTYNFFIFMGMHYVIRLGLKWLIIILSFLFFLSASVLYFFSLKSSLCNLCKSFVRMYFASITL